MEAIRRVTAGLNQPIQRAGFVLLLLGVAVTAIGLTQIYLKAGSYYWFERFIGTAWDAIWFDNNTYRRYPLACIGPWVIITGLLFSFLYDRTFGRLLIWIRNG